MRNRDLASFRPARRSLVRGLAVVAVTAALTLALAVLAGRAVGLPAARFGFLAALFGGATLVLALTAQSGTAGDSSGSLVLLQVLRGHSIDGDGDGGPGPVFQASLLLLLGVLVGGFAAIVLPV